MEIPPLISIIIPAYRRPESLAKVLEALSHQTFPAAGFEVIVVVDGPSPSVEQILTANCRPFRTRPFVRPHQGETSARNFGLERAEAEILVFLDDDTVPAPELLARHFECHRQGTDLVVVGAVRAHPESPEKFLAETVDWAEGHFKRCSAPGYQLTHRDLPDNNFSTRKEHLLRIRGWDESLAGYGGIDDWEIGRRLQQMGLRFRFEPRALAYHYYCKTLVQLLEHTHVAGRAQIYYLRKFPDRLCDLSLPKWATGPWRERWILQVSRVLPEFTLTLSGKLLAPLVRGHGPQRGLTLTRLAVKLLWALSLCRGLWDEPGEMQRIIRQLRLRVPILVFPHVRAAAGVESHSSLPAEQFARRISDLKEWGYQAVSLGDFCQWQKCLRPLPSNPVILTFDGNDRGLRDQITSILREHNFRATVFMAAGREGQHFASMDGVIPSIEDGVDVSELVQLGFDIGSYGLMLQGRDYVGRSPGSQQSALMALLTKEIGGHTVKFLAYPNNVWAPALRGLAESAGFEAACTHEAGVNDFNEDRFLLKRIPVLPGLGRWRFRRALRGAGSTSPAHETWRSYWFHELSPGHQSDTPEFYRMYAQELKLLFGEKARSHVLEVGCGNGALFPYLGFEQTSYRGVDFSPSMVTAFKAKHPEVDVICHEGSSYFDPEKKYDLVFSNGVIQYFDRAMLDRHFACARSMMENESLFVCAWVPWRVHRSMFYSGVFECGKRPSVLKSMAGVMRRMLMKDVIGHWFDLEEIAEQADQHGLSVRFHGSLFYHHCFHAVMKLK